VCFFGGMGAVLEFAFFLSPPLIGRPLCPDFSTAIAGDPLIVCPVFPSETLPLLTLYNLTHLVLLYLKLRLYLSELPHLPPMSSLIDAHLDSLSRLVSKRRDTFSPSNPTRRSLSAHEPSLINKLSNPGGPPPLDYTISFDAPPFPPSFRNLSCKWFLIPPLK